MMTKKEITLKKAEIYAILATSCSDSSAFLMRKDLIKESLDLMKKVET